MKNKKKAQETILMAIVVISLMLLGICIFLLIQYLVEDFGEIFSFKKPLKSEEEILKDCANLSLIETSKCLNYHIKKLYYYNYSNVVVSSRKMDFERLVREGGVCKHYAKFYELFGKKLGFSVKHISLLPDLKHGFSVLYDNRTKSYCILDQQDIIGCNLLG